MVDLSFISSRIDLLLKVLLAMVRTMMFRQLIFLTLMISTIFFSFAGGLEDGYPDDTGVAGPAFFGFVRDERGSNIPKATIFLKPKTGQPVVVQANILGLYRSHVTPTTVAEDITITCEKPGYKQTRLVRRPRSSVKLIETDCMMQKVK